MREEGTFTAAEYDALLAGQDKPFNAIATPKPWFDFWIKELYGIEPGSVEYNALFAEVEDGDSRLQT